MKVICVDNKYCERSLAIGKNYEVLDIHDDSSCDKINIINDHFYHIINDKNIEDWYRMYCFRILSKAEIRNEKNR